MHTITKPSRPPVLEVLRPGYLALFDRAVAVFVADERVRALWLSGSLASGSADVASDLDLLVAVGDDDHEAFTGAWEEWLAAITPTLIVRPLGFAAGSFHAVTPGRERLDVVVEPVAALTNTFFRHRLVVFDRDGLDATLPAPDPAPGPSPAKVAGLVEEFFRDYGLFETVVEREDWLLGLEAIHLLRGLLYQLFAEANAPLPASGIKRWSTKLTPDQRRLLESLPTGAAHHDAVVDAHEAVAAAFVDQARPICAELGVRWPDELEEATLDYLRSIGLPTYR